MYPISGELCYNYLTQHHYNFIVRKDMHVCNQAIWIKRHRFQLVLRSHPFLIPAATPTILTELLAISTQSLYAVTELVPECKP
jgi:hypothetical protein